MDYLERLLRRALAQPRDAGAALLDPFEQSLPWGAELPAADASGPSLAKPPAPHNAMVPGADPGHALTGVAQLTASAAPAGSMAAGRALRLDAWSGATPAAAGDHRLAQREPAGPPVEVAASNPTVAVSAAVPARPAAQALAQADAFMRARGVAGAEPAGPGRALAAGPGAAPAIAARSAVAGPAQPVPLLRPPPPLPSEPRLPGPGPQRRRMAAPAPQPAPAAAAARGPAAPVAAERSAMHPLPLPAAVRRLDDLAHSSRITRFGIGQG